AERMRRDLARRVEESGIAADGANWLKEVGEATVQALAVRGSATGGELAQDEPRLRAQIVYAADKSYGGPVNVTTRLLTLLSAEGLIVRGRPRGGWTSSQFTWSAAPDQPRPPASAARAELARRWLLAFGPAAVADPWPALLPALDPAAMGWRERGWYLGGHAAALFDRSGNIGRTAWWDGRIVGGWAQRKDGEIVLRLLEDAGREASAALAA